MSERRGLTFGERDRVATDGVTFVDCRFQRATLVYSGGEHPHFERCAFSNATWTFDGPALRTVGLLQAINGAPGGDAFVADLLRPAPTESKPPARSF
jgi:hypothetical protein